MSELGDRDTAIIGAGPGGMTAAYQLSKFGVRPEVFEAGPHIGGLARSIDLWGQKVDLGPHRFFSQDPRVNGLWDELIGKDYDLVDRLTRIYYQGRFFYYPLQPLNALSNLGFLEATRCVLSYLNQKCKNTSETEINASFESWVVNRFGNRLFEIFFKSYSEKLWGMPCDELDSDFASQRIKKLSFAEAVKNAVWKGGEKSGTKHRTLLDSFKYPHGGSGELYARMAGAVKQRGGEVYLRSPVSSVLVDKGRVAGLQLADGKRREFSRVLSTMPLTQLVLTLQGVPQEVVEAARSLSFRNTTLVYLKINRSNVFPDNWIYVHSNALKTGRICNFRNWSSHLYGNHPETILCLEYWSYDSDPLWSASDTELASIAGDDLCRTGLVKREDIVDSHVHRIHRSYPVYRRGYKPALRLIERYLDTVSGLTVIGRGGAFKYNNQDHSILMGVLAAENLAFGSRHDLWGVNTGEEYQEEGIHAVPALTPRSVSIS